MFEHIATEVGVGIFLYLYYIKFCIFLVFSAISMSGFFQLISLNELMQELSKFCKNNSSNSCIDYLKTNPTFFSSSYQNLSIIHY